MPRNRSTGRLVAVVVVVVVVAVAAVVAAVQLSSRSHATTAHVASIIRPCTKLPQTAQVYDTPVPASDPAPVDPLAVVPSPGGGSFVDTVTGAPFVPRGAHYVRLTTVHLSSNYAICMASDFDTGTGLDAYDPHRAAAALAQMSSYGYNVVRVGLNPEEIGNPTGEGLDTTYLANLASFINIARADDIRVMIGVLPLPAHGGYLPTGAPYTTPGTPQFHNQNLYYTDATFLSAQERYLSDLITGLEAQGANLSDLFSIELRGEVFFTQNQWPMNVTSGTVQTDAQTQPFDMSAPGARDTLMDVTTLYWENQLTDSVHAALPHVLVSVGFFTPYALVTFPQTGRISRPESSLSAQSHVDFVDLHMYPIFGSGPDQVGSLGVAAPDITKPLVLGEFGEYTREAPTPAVAAANLVAWQQQSCDLDGFKFSGWITWTWDTQPSEQPGIYNMVDGDDAIAAALSPRQRPDPCQ